MYKSGRHIFIVLLLLVIGYQSFGQLRPVIRRPPNFQQRVIKQQQISRVEAVKEKYIARRLSLTTEQSARFWPIYRRYRDALTAVRAKKHANDLQPDGTEQINNELFYESELVNIRKFYTDEFLKVLPPEKVSEMFKAEKEFTNELIRQLRERQAVGSNSAPPS
ncbi:hypothetical protein [Mucilaginibacter sp.]|jgi:hypothetical protein|uniref:hypothetical protein n=1 Tax=Mucilaginibacter sp. TaxID=1882438 RepID=UPI002C454162|nr:hypothetical protein [Mucilaginibacter sp.]HTI60609.1 hypothetical protein [Mucilaginibacter sp.]